MNPPASPFPAVIVGYLVRGVAWLALTLTSSCESGCQNPRDEEVPAPQAPLVTAPSVQPAQLAQGPAVTSDVSVAGLRVTSGTLGDGGHWGFSELALDLRAVGLEVVSAKGRRFDELLPPRALAVVNGGYFEEDLRPTAWLVSGKKQLARRVETTRGGVLAVSANREVFVGALSGLGFAPEFALQSFPLIVEDGGTPGIARDDGRRAARNVACVVAGALHFVLITAPRGEGPTLHESMAVLRDAPPRGFGCTSALNLDGGPSVGVWYAPSIAARPRLPLAPIAYGIAIVAR